MYIVEVVITERAKAGLIKAPRYIAKKLHAWIEQIIHQGLRETRKIRGYHDELLKGERAGERSVRLSKGYRAIYIITKNGSIEIVKILEVNKHVY